MPDEPESSDADAMSDSSLSDACDVIQGKAKGRAPTRKTESKSRTQPRHLSDAHHIYLASCPGCIPDGLGVVLRDGNPEHDNTMWGTMGKEFYHSPLSNIVYVSHTAVAAMEHETPQGSGYTDVNSQCLYSILPRGFPMNPHSVVRAVHFVCTSKESGQDHVEGFKLLEEF
jgi:hypothetical protein